MRVYECCINLKDLRLNKNGVEEDDGKKLKPDNISLTSLQISAPGNISTAESSRAIRDAVCLANGVELTRDSGEFATQHLYPRYIRDVQPKVLQKGTKLKCEVFDKKKLENLGWGLFSL